MERLWDPYSKTNISDPYPMYQRLRENDPVHHAQTGEYILTRYEDINRVLNDPLFISGNRLEWIRRQVEYLKNKDIDIQAVADAIQSFVVLLNPPEHTKVRKIVTDAWFDHDVEGIIGENIDHLTNGLNTSRFDIVKDYASKLPAMTIARIMGLSDPDFSKLKDISLKLMQTLNLYVTYKQLVEMDEAAREFIRFLRTHVREKSNNPGEDLISRVILTNNKEEDPLTEDQLVSVCIFLFIAGEETNVNMISTGMLNLLKNPDQLEALRKNDSYYPSAVEELMRLDGPVHLIGRIASEEVELGGIVIPADGTLTLCLGAANRDPDAFKRPDDLDIQRDPNRHFGFGGGSHYCIGAWLARIQGAMGIKALLDRFPNLHLEEQTLQWYDHLSIRGLLSLMARN